MKKKHLAEIGYVFLLTAFTLYLILDTFVISSAYQEDAVQMNTAIFAEPEETSLEEEGSESDDTSAVLSEFAEAGIASAQSYEDENINMIFCFFHIFEEILIHKLHIMTRKQCPLIVIKRCPNSVCIKAFKKYHPIL